jgi:glycosyltransferase involved in cell wall biosynthesis
VKDDNKMIKILFLSAKYSGDYHLINNMVLGLDSKRYTARVCYLEGTSDGKNTLDEHDKSMYLEDELGRGASRIKRLLALRRLIIREAPDIVHPHRHQPTIYAVMARLFGACRVIVAHDHGTRKERFRKFRKRLGYWFFYRWVKRLITVSEMSRSEVLDVYGFMSEDKVVAVLNGIDLAVLDSKVLRPEIVRIEARERMGVKGDELIFGTVGRLSSKKGHTYMLQAFSEVSKELPSARLVIVGTGPLAEELRLESEELGISSMVNFMGFRKDVPELLRGFDVFTFPSLSEGLPLALLEAMGSRLPVVASDGRGIPEVFEGERVFGRLTKMKNPPELARAMLELAAMSAKERQALGEQARLRVEDAFTAEGMCESLMKVYDEAGAN